MPPTRSRSPLSLPLGQEADDSVTVTLSPADPPVPGRRRPVDCACHRCGRVWTVALAPGRRPIVCPDCRAAHAAELAARRMRRYRQRAQEQADHEAYVHDRRVQWVADRLLADHPAAAKVLAEVPYDLAEDLVQELQRRLADAAGLPQRDSPKAAAE